MKVRKMWNCEKWKYEKRGKCGKCENVECERINEKNVKMWKYEIVKNMQMWKC